MATAILCRNGLFLAALVGVALRRRWGWWAFLASAALGLVRRGLFLWPLLDWHGPDLALAQGGADFMYRLMALGILLDAARDDRP